MLLKAVSPNGRKGTRPVTAVIFDVGGVLIEWDPRHLYRRLFDGDEAAMETFLTFVCSTTWNLMQDAGRPFADGVADLTARFPEHAARIAAFDTRWEEMVPGAIDDTVDVLAALKAAGTPLYALTNFSAEKFALTRRRFPFFDLFDGIVVSGEVGLIKPDRGIYLHLMRTYGLEPTDCLFIDDSPINVLGARTIGMDTILFEGAASLQAELARRRIVSDVGPL